MTSNLTTSEKKLRLKELTKLLTQYDEEYYQNDAPSISDAEYDKLKSEALKLEEELSSTDLFGNLTISQKVGSKVKSGFKKSHIKFQCFHLKIFLLMMT